MTLIKSEIDNDVNLFEYFKSCRFFCFFFVFCKKTKISYGAPLSMSTFFDSIFFVGEQSMATMIARIILFLFMPALVLLRVGIDLKDLYLFILMVGAWCFLMYCYCYRSDIKPGKIKSSAIFSEIFLQKELVFGVCFCGDLG